MFEERNVMKKRILPQRGGVLNDEDRLMLVRLLAKAGYSVRIGRQKPATGKGAAVIFVEYWEDNGDG
jgi:hypothetical protein